MKPAKIERALKRAEIAAWNAGHEARWKHQKAMETFVREVQEDNAELDAAYQQKQIEYQMEALRHQVSIMQAFMGNF
jgi:predicted alpha/beta superfamily hydrolase